MNDIQQRIESNGKGSFFIEEAGERIAEMVVSVDDKNITVFHTVVSPALKGQNIGTRLIEAMVAYARDRRLKVIALCPFVSAQFKRHPELYDDIWNQKWR